MSDKTDPYFTFHSHNFTSKIKNEFADKFEIKNLIKVDGINFPKNYFTWDKSGKISLCGEAELPKSGKIVLKSSNGSGFVKIVDACYVTPEMLKKLYKKWYWQSQFFGKLKGEKHYSLNSTVLFAEEYLGENIEDFKIHISKNGYIFMHCKDRWDKDNKIEAKKREYNSEFKALFGSSTGELSSEIDSRTKSVFESIIPKAKSISNLLNNNYCRIDFFVVNNKVYLGEITFTSDNGKVFSNAPFEAHADVISFLKIIKS